MLKHNRPYVTAPIPLPLTTKLDPALTLVPALGLGEHDVLVVLGGHDEEASCSATRVGITMGIRMCTIYSDFALACVAPSLAHRVIIKMLLFTFVRAFLALLMLGAVDAANNSTIASNSFFSIIDNAKIGSSLT